MGEHWLTVGYYESSNHWRRTREFENYEDNYSLSDVQVGYRYKTKFEALPSWMREGGPHIEVGRSKISGDERNRGSNRRQIELRLGWRQDFFKYLFLDPAVGMGGGESESDFGRGFPLEAERSVTIQTQVQVGVELCLGGSPCLAITGGYFWERSVTDPAYVNYGPLIGFDISALLWGKTAEEEAEERESERQAAHTRSLEERLLAYQSHQCPIPEPQVVTQIVPKVVTRTEEVPIEVSPSPERLALMAGIQFLNKATEITFEAEYGPDGKFVALKNAQLEAIAAYLRDNPRLRVKLHGHANDTGPEDENRRYSLERAYSVRHYLVHEAGIPEERVLVDGKFVTAVDGERLRIFDAEGTSVHGSGDPDFPDPADVRNRRVEFEELWDNP